jgi:hypothetical protein
MPAPIFNFRNVKKRVPDNQPLSIYTVALQSPSDTNGTLPLGVAPSEVSVVLLTVQCANITGNSTQTPTPRKNHQPQCLGGEQ